MRRWIEGSPTKQKGLRIEERGLSARERLVTRAQRRKVETRGDVAWQPFVLVRVATPLEKRKGGTSPHQPNTDQTNVSNAKSARQTSSSIAVVARRQCWLGCVFGREDRPRGFLAGRGQTATSKQSNERARPARMNGMVACTVVDHLDSIACQAGISFDRSTRCICWTAFSIQQTSKSTPPSPPSRMRSQPHPPPSGKRSIRSYASFPCILDPCFETPPWQPPVGPPCLTHSKPICQSPTRTGSSRVCPNRRRLRLVQRVRASTSAAAASDI